MADLRGGIEAYASTSWSATSTRGRSSGSSGSSASGPVGTRAARRGARRLVQRMVGPPCCGAGPSASGPMSGRCRRPRREPLRVDGAGRPARVPPPGAGAARAARAAASASHVAVVVPSFRRGSGGHSTIANLVRGLEARGHDVLAVARRTAQRRAARDSSCFGPSAGRCTGFGGWEGADVVVATGWQTVHRALLLPGAGARAYLVQDHEPEFYGTSAERTWAEETYGLGLHCVCASRWLAGLVRARYGASASHFDLGVDHDAYRPLDGVAPARERVLFYARAVTAAARGPARPARARGAAAAPDVEIALFGEARPLATRFATHLGVLDARRLARHYAEATVGVVLSMTNPSLVPTEMLACGLPVVDVASEAMVATFGGDGPIALATSTPGARRAIERLLDDPRERARRSQAGIELVRGAHMGGGGGPGRGRAARGDGYRQPVLASMSLVAARSHVDRRQERGRRNAEDEHRGGPADPRPAGPEHRRASGDGGRACADAPGLGLLEVHEEVGQRRLPVDVGHRARHRPDALVDAYRTTSRSPSLRMQMVTSVGSAGGVTGTTTRSLSP